MAKVGDIVRYLNATGGGEIVRIEGNIAYVDEDGFETPVLVKECVVVGDNNSQNKRIEPPVVTSQPPAQTKGKSSEPEIPVMETPEGEKLNVTLAFEPKNLLSLSNADIDTYLVNDSNYFLYFSYSTSEDGKSWLTRYAGVVEPNIQLFLENIHQDNMAGMDKISLQLLAFKKDKRFSLKQPVNVEFKFDCTKFFKRHCYKADDYFDKDVIAFRIVCDDLPMGQNSLSEISMLNDKEPTPLKGQDFQRRKVVKKKKKENAKNETIIVDLHIEELLDNTKGMTNADILNYQIDEFRKVMDANLRNKGQKLVFIHGKGEGVLRNALLKELSHRYKSHDVQDASFREYGFGATQVTIR